MSVLNDFRHTPKEVKLKMFGPHYVDTPFAATVKGAPNFVLAKANQWVTKAGIVPLTEADKQAILKRKLCFFSSSPASFPVTPTLTFSCAQLPEIDDFSEQAFRVLAVAMQPRPSAEATDPSTLEDNLILVGLVASIDPERTEVAPSIEKAATAGIRTVMITGGKNFFPCVYHVTLYSALLLI